MLPLRPSNASLLREQSALYSAPFHKQSRLLGQEEVFCLAALLHPLFSNNLAHSSAVQQKAGTRSKMSPIGSSKRSMLVLCIYVPGFKKSTSVAYRSSSPIEHSLHVLPKVSACLVGVPGRALLTRINLTA